MKLHRACRLAIVGAILAPALVRAEDAAELAASGPIVLVHPQINKSIGNPVHCLALSHDGKTLFTGAASGALVWDTGSGKLLRTLDADERAVDTLALDPRGGLLVAGGASGIVKVFDARTWKPIHTLGPASGAVCGLSISPDGKLLASAAPNGQPREADRPVGIFLWNLATGEQLRTLPHPPPAFGATALAFHPDGKQLVTAQDRMFRVLDVETGEEIKVNELPDLPRSLGCIALRGDGRRLITGAFEPAIRLWDTQSFKQVFAWEAHTRQPPPRQGVSSVSFSPRGNYVLSGGMDGMVCVWEASSGRCLLELDGRGESSGRWITGVAMTPDGNLLAAAHCGVTATIWRISERK